MHRKILKSKKATWGTGLQNGRLPITQDMVCIIKAIKHLIMAYSRRKWAFT